MPEKRAKKAAPKRQGLGARRPAPAPQAPSAKPKRKPFTAEDAAALEVKNAEVRKQLEEKKSQRRGMPTKFGENPKFDQHRTGRLSMGAEKQIFPETWELFLSELGECANVSKACAAANISRDYAYDMKRADKAFSARWDEAYDRGYLKLEEEAQRRAFEGVDRPVYFKGLVVDSVKEYSDTLTMFLMKGRMRRVFGDKQEVTVNRGDSPYAKMSDEELNEFIQAQLRGDE